jgi:cation:H+ antiporter
MSVTTIALFILGLALLIAGAEFLVRGAARLAAAAGVSPLVVGLTIVALGTSSPELAVSVSSSLAGQSDLVVGNVVGSNIYNILLILGIGAVVAPLIVSQRLVRLDVPLVIGASILMLLLALDGKIGRVEGGLLFAGIVAYIVFAIIQARREENATVKQEYAQEFGVGKRLSGRQIVLQIVMIVGGLAALILGSTWLVASAVAIARSLGLSELLIGLTIVAIGTSSPEIATSVIAGIKGETDIAVGNAVGSNLFNILAVLGLAAIVAPQPQGVTVAPNAMRFDIPVMIGVAIACLPIFFIGYRVSRWEGALFLAYAAAYVAYLILNATQNTLLPLFAAAMLYFVLPLTVITLAVLTVRAWRVQHPQKADTPSRK